MKNFIIKRLLQLIPILVGITFLSFALIRIAGSDAVAMKYERAGTVVSDELIQSEREKLGLDKPFFEQYLSWLKKAMRGDMGISYSQKKPVAEIFFSKLPATILLCFAAALLTLVISIPLGIVSALRQDSFVDYLLRFVCFIGNSLPNFFIAILLIYFLSVKLKLLPVISPVNSLKGIIMPSLTLALAMSAKYTRQVRATILEEYSKDYVIGARARGVSEWLILYKSVLRSAVLTLMSLFSLSIGSLLGGTAIVESIFMWDGIGRLALDAINMRDYPVIQAYVLWMAIVYVFINLLADVLQYFMDPRIRLGEGN